ncbi:MAG: KpsF/GutQ family sugar-phosphate isomerase [Betaproteobacteria bacterium]|nr:KpsF/GutQ family sugar-phosphate isomerase [Betaproteobacteria bacterium]
MPSTLSADQKSLSPPHDAVQALELARRVLRTEAAAVEALIPRLDEQFVEALQIILHCAGRVVVSGIGKSGHIARKIASTLASTGTPAFFVHPAEASHGDLGMITADDVLIALSNSGESAELVSIVPLLKRKGARLIALTGNARSSLGRAADVHLDTSVAEEACPLGLAPTASTTATLALGDALAIALLDARGFGPDDFARSHPGGALGRRLLVHVRDIMHGGDAIPKVPHDALVSHALLEMSRKGLGMTAVVDDAGSLIGIYTDGDLRRTLDMGVELRTTPITQVMTRSPLTIRPDSLAAQAVQLMESRKVNGLLVVDEAGRLLGAFNMLDVLRAGVV